MSSLPWPVLRALGVAWPMMREVVAVRHQFDQAFVIDASATTAAFGLTATPWSEVVRATVSGVAVPA